MPINKQIEVLSVGQPVFTKTTKGGYNSIEVAYKSDGKVEGKKIVDFSNKDIYAQVAQMQPGQSANITLDKDPKGYWQWVGIALGGGQVSQAPATQGSQTGNPPQATGGRVTGSNYETPDERRLRRAFECLKHRQIGRQGCLNIALAYLSSPKGPITQSAEEVIDTARQFESYVFNKENSEIAKIQSTDIDALAGLTDDIPF
jgi:hypothetical protein